VLAQHRAAGRNDNIVNGPNESALVLPDMTRRVRVVLADELDEPRTGESKEGGQSNRGQVRE